MIKIDLITGFLGSGKTTFIRHYAGHFLEAGQRICILENDFGAINVDRVLLQDLSDESEYLMASQCACAGRLILSRTQLYDETKQERVIAHINTAMEKIGSRRRFSREDIEAIPWDEFAPDDYDRLAGSGYVCDNYVKQQVIENGHFTSLFCYHLELPEEELRDRIRELFSDPRCEGVFRIKGYMHITDGRWMQINATRAAVEIIGCMEAQNVLIVIGEGLDREAIERYFPVQGI